MDDSIFKNASSFQKYFLSALQRKANVLKLIQKSSVFDGQLIWISVDVSSLLAF